MTKDSKVAGAGWGRLVYGSASSNQAPQWRVPLWLRLTLLFILVAVVPATALGYANSRATQESLIELAQAENEEFAHFAASLANQTLQQSLGDVELLAALDPIASFLLGRSGEAAANRTLVGFTRTHQHFVAFLLLDTQGRLLATSSPNGSMQVGENRSDIEAFRQVRITRAPSIGAIGHLLPSGHPTLELAAPVAGTDLTGGNLLGVVVGVLSLDTLAPSVRASGSADLRGDRGIAPSGRDASERAGDQPAALPSKVQISIVDPEREQFVATRDPAQVLATVPPWLGALVRDAAKQPSGRLSFNGLNGEPTLAGYATMPVTGWVAIAEQSAVGALAPVVAIQRALAAVLLMALGASILVAFTLGQVLSWPVMRLTRAARALGQGRFDVALPRPGSDEVGELTVAFSTMRGQLAQLLVDARDQANRAEAAQQEAVRLLREAERSAARLQSLSSTVSAVGAAQDLSGASRALLQGAVALLDGSSGAVALFDPATGKQHVLTLFADGRFAEVPDAPPPPEGTHQWHLFRGSPSRLVGDTTAAPDAANAWESVQDSSVRSSISVPIDLLAPADDPILVPDHAGGTHPVQPVHPAIRPQRRIGMLQVNSTATHHFTHDDVALAETVAGQAAAAVERARLVTAEREARAAALEAEIQATRSERLRALGQMASGIAHDLNQSLAMIAGYSELGRRQLDRSLAAGTIDSTAIGETFSIVGQAAVDGAETVKRLLTFVRSQPEGVKEQIDAGALLREVARLTAPRWSDATQAEGRPVSLHVDVDLTQGPLVIEGWLASLRECLTNLVFNAVDALPAGGSIRLGAHRRGQQVLVEVEDTGVGMSAEVQARVFEPFFTTKGERGTGLGLAMVYGIVERHGGRVDLISAPGEGTTFRLWLPITLPQEETTEFEPSAPTNSAAGQIDPAGELGGPVGLAALEPAASQPLAILAVDDQRPLADMVALMLRPHGHTVTVATSGEAALERLRTQRFDVVISDVGMGAGMNGWELADAVRLHYPDIRFYLATGWGAQISQEEAQSRGVVAVAAKPYRSEDLLRLLAEPGVRPAGGPTSDSRAESMPDPVPEAPPGPMDAAHTAAT